MRFFNIFSGRSACFKFVLFCVVAVLGCAWPPWLFYVASGVKREIRLFHVVSNCLCCFLLVFIVYNCLLVV